MLMVNSISTTICNINLFIHEAVYVNYTELSLVKSQQELGLYEIGSVHVHTNYFFSSKWISPKHKFN